MFESYKISKAVEKNDLLRLEKLLLKGVSPDLRDESYDPLPIEIAIWNGHVEAARTLLEHGSNPLLRNRHNSCSGNIFDLAIYYKQYEVARMIMARFPEVLGLQNGKTPLHHAATNGDLDGVKFLLDAGVDPLIKSESNRLAIYYASEKKYDDVIEVLQPYSEKLQQQKLLSMPQTPDSWQKLGDEKIAHITVDNVIGFRITDIFNFSAEERTTIYESLSKPVQSMDVKQFEHSSAAAVEEAFARLKEQAGLEKFGATFARKTFGK